MAWLDWTVQFVALGGIGVVLMKAAVELYFLVAGKIAAIVLAD